MYPNTDLRAKTANHFDSVNFSELNDRWIENVVDNEFTDAEENDISISVLFVHEPLKTLFNLADVCLAWCENLNGEASVVSNDPDASSDKEVLWTVLNEMDINVKQIQGIIYLLCQRAVKKNSTVNDKSCGLASAKLYFNCLKVPGSGAYSVYHNNLFSLCIDCLPAPDFTVTDTSTSREFENLASIFISSLLSLIPVLRDFHLGDDSHTLEHTIKKLADIAACEVQTHIKFSINFLDLGERELRRQFKPSLAVSALAYSALSAILVTELNGDRDENYLSILSHLNKHILCLKARKSPSVSQKILMIKDNAVNFVCYNLKTKDFCDEATQIAVKRVCLAVIDKQEMRSAVSAAVIAILISMKSQHLAEMLEWLLLFVDSADTKDRAIALDILGQFLSKTFDVDTNQLPDCLKDNSLMAAIIFSILTRCDDIIPAVRTRALNVLSHNVKYVLNFLAKTKDQATFEMNDEEEECDRDLDINGNHRYFWYNLDSYRERLNEIVAILQRRIADKNVNARKATVEALEHLIVFDPTYITEENLKFFDSAAKDSHIVVRKQVIQSLSVILESYRENVDIQDCWLRCIMPLIHDPEASVQAKALSVLEELFLYKVFSSTQTDRECAFQLLKSLSSGNFMAHQRYLQKSFSLWKTENKLKPQAVIQFEKYIATEWEECIWFYISNFALYKSVPPKILNLCIEQFQKIVSSGVYPSFMEYLMKVIMYMLKNLSLENSESVQRNVSESLKSFCVSVELIPIHVEILYKIYKHQNAESKFFEFSSEVIQICNERLGEIKSAKSFPEPPSEDLIIKYFSTIKEICQYSPSNIADVKSILKTFTACDKPSKTLSKILSPCVKAHAFAALGKICIQDEILAKELLPAFAKELLTSKFDVIRNNVVIILIEMCKRYTSFADKYVPLISLCFKDKVYLIRYQTIVLIVNLLQEEYIKFRGHLFFCLLSTLVDKKDAIQELGRYSLSQLLRDKKKNLFSEHFIDSIFVYNNFPPPDNETIAQSVKDLECFSLPGEQKREDRMFLYKFLLESMQMNDRMYLIRAVCDIMANVAESVYSLGEKTECILRDCFAILASKEMRALDIDGPNEEVNENEDLTKKEIGLRRVYLIDPIIPVIVNLKNGITDPESDLMHDIVLFLKELLHDYRDSLRDILAVDKILLRQLELEIKNDTEKERAEKRMEKNAKERHRQTSKEDSEKDAQLSMTLESIQTMIKGVSKIMEQEKEDKGTQETALLPHSTPRTTHLSKQVRALQRSLHRSMPSTSHASSSGENLQQQTYNVALASDAESADMQRFASTPRVVLTAVKVPLSNNFMNVSAIECVSEPMNLEDIDSDIL